VSQRRRADTVLTKEKKHDWVPLANMCVRYPRKFSNFCSRLDERDRAASYGIVVVTEALS
jgi:hypothetical protein